MTGLKLLLVGCGRMGHAILDRLMHVPFFGQFVVVEPTSFEKVEPTVTWVQQPTQIPSSFQPDVVLLAVKPQHISSVVPFYAKYSSSLFVSIAAGITLKNLQTLLGGESVSIVRSMPNLPASVGVGMTVAVANGHTTEKQRVLADQLLQAIGQTAWIRDEKLMDAATALSGSGPAYVFALCEAMAKAGEALGLTAELSAQLSRQTIIGSGVLLTHLVDSPEVLRKAVTSPGGTTETALRHLVDEQQLYKLMKKAMLAAALRAQELARG